MKRKNLIARKKVKKDQLLFIDPKIISLYKKFKFTISKNIRKKNF